MIVAVEKAQIKIDILTQNDGVTNEIMDFGQYINNEGRVHDHAVGDTGQVGDELVDRLARIDQFGKLGNHTVVVELDCSDFNDRIVFRVQTRCFNVQGYNFRHERNYTRQCP